uniref:Uncharacterized protein LOC104222081 n=1 Tax=Nicotiana sylvestris TaxID=4096 RepID=A0A1U7VYW8_NICSY|nr:PREDICTED: uncharacterized protein LOC104222081 [Nicotiana sylvestris]
MLEVVLLAFDDDEMNGFMVYVNSLQGIGSYNFAPQKLSLDIENRTNSPTMPSIEEPPTLELKPLLPHLRYEFLGPCYTLLVIRSSCLTNMHVDSTLVVLQKRKMAIRWTLVDIQGISFAFCMHKIKLEDGAKPSIDIKGDSMSLCKKLSRRRLSIGWIPGLFTPSPIVHGPLRLASRAFYCFIDGYSGYNQILITPKDQEKTTFTCPCGTFAFKRMPFGLCNEPTTFQKCMMAILTDMVEDYLEVFMVDFSVVRDSFDDFLANLDKVLA